MAEPDLTDAEKRKLRRIMATPSPSLWDRIKPGLVGGLTAAITVVGVYITWGQLQEDRRANELNIKAGQADVTFKAVFSSPDKDKPGEQRVQTEGKLTENMLRTAPSFIRLDVRNDSPLKVTIQDMGLQLGGGRMVWATELAKNSPISGCDQTDHWDNVTCEGLFPKTIEGPSVFTFDFPMFTHVDELRSNGGAEDEGIKFTLVAVGAGKDQIEVVTGFYIA